MSDIIKIAVLAVGGQGGGVLSSWIAALAEGNNYVAQVTSVAGVAQRTGATIYYIEIAPKGPQRPVFALSPSPGDIDVLIAAEIMEAGRAAQRGFLSPDRTTLIASTHRILAVSEKQVPGDGRADGSAVTQELQGYAKHVVAFDMEKLALDAGSLISASLFGGLARSNALPFTQDAYRAVLK
jgi:indolepyruvate ferredoxin oxidoreductase beta subunit